MECNFENVIACLPQFWNWLEDTRGKDDKMSRGAWKAVETKTGETGVVKTEEERKERRRRKEMRGKWTEEKRKKEKKKKLKKEKIIEVKKNSKRMRDLE